MAKKSIRVCSKRDDHEKEQKCRERIGGLLKLIGYKCPITDRATLRAEAERKLNEINQRKRKLAVHQPEYSCSSSEIKKLVPSRLNHRGVKCGRKVNNMVNRENRKQSRGGIINPVKVRSYIEKIIRRRLGGGAVEEMELVFEKILTASDVNNAQGRLLMPLKQVKRQEVLKEIMKRENKRVDVYVYDYAMAEEEHEDSDDCYELCLGQWDMNRNQNYVLKYHWNQVVEENQLRENMMVQLWSFQVRDHIPACLLLVPVAGAGETDESGGGSADEGVGGGVIIQEPTLIVESSYTSEDEERLRSRKGKRKVQE